MTEQQDKACGADIHKDFLVACILSRDGSKVIDKFDMTLEGILNFEEWLKANGCNKVAVESTGNYWHLVYQVLEDDFEFILANAFQTRGHPGAKTDRLDAEWLAELCLNNQIKPSRILPEKDREFRALTRARKGYMDFRSKLKSRIIQELEACTIKLSSVLSDIFGVTGRHILLGLIDGKNIDDIVQKLPSTRIKASKEEIKEAIQAGLRPVSMFLLQSHLELMDDVDKKVERIDIECHSLIQRRRRTDLEIAMSMPGIGFVSAVAILSEIGDYRNFKRGEQLAAFSGLDPSVYESAGKKYTGPITKQGSKYLRRIMVECAHALSNTKAKTRLKRFYLRVLAKKGKKVAIVALARKMLCILYHLLVNQEVYKDEGLEKPKQVKVKYSDISNYPSLEEMIKIIGAAGYKVMKEPPEG